MSPLFAFLLVSACTSDLTVRYGQEACSDTGEADTLGSTFAGEAAKVWRRQDEQPSTGLTFTPDIEPDGEYLHVREAWSDGVDETPWCYQPFVEVDGITSLLEVRWYDGERNTPTATVVLDPD